MRKTFFRRNTDVFQGKMTRRTAKRPDVRVRWELEEYTLKPVLWAVDPRAPLAGSCVVAPAFVISYKFEKNFWKRSYKLWDLGSESHDDELRYCGGGSGGDDSHFCGAADDGIRSCRRAVRPCGSRSRSRGRRRQACSPGQISLCRRSRSSGSRGGTERA